MDEKATQLHAIASLKVLLDATKPNNGSSSSTAANHVTLTSQLSQETKLAATDQPNGVATGLEDAGDTVGIKKFNLFQAGCMFLIHSTSTLSPPPLKFIPIFF